VRKGRHVRIDKQSLEEIFSEWPSRAIKGGTRTSARRHDPAVAVITNEDKKAVMEALETATPWRYPYEEITRARRGMGGVLAAPKHALACNSGTASLHMARGCRRAWEPAMKVLCRVHLPGVGPRASCTPTASRSRGHRAEHVLHRQQEDRGAHQREDEGDRVVDIHGNAVRLRRDPRRSPAKTA